MPDPIAPEGPPADTAGAASRPERDRERADVLVFSPHPDDECLGCAGVILESLAAGKQVRVVFLTNGDAFPFATSIFFGEPQERLTVRHYLAMAGVRQREALAALGILGLSSSHVFFLGYPDGGLFDLYFTRHTGLFTQPLTGKTGTYGVFRPDYHSVRHGCPAPYTRRSVQADIGELLRRFEPRQIFVTAEADTHADHQAAFWFVRDAVKAAGCRSEVLTYIVHADLGDLYWPWPRGATPACRFEPVEVKGTRIPIGVHWPPADRRPMGASHNRQKLRALRAYASQMCFATSEQFLESFVKAEEVFWRYDAEDRAAAGPPPSDHGPVSFRP